MRLVFMGTPDFAVPTLRALVSGGHDVVGVITQPDRSAGRGKTSKFSPVKVAALELGLPVYQPEKIKTPEWVQQLRVLAPECIIVVAYGQLLSKEILQLPLRGCINVHASLLPAYRGAAPIHWAVMKGESRTGVTTMLMDEGLDTGDMLLKQEIIIPLEATMGTIHDELAHLGADLLLETLKELAKGSLHPTPQTGESNYAPLLKREHERLDWTRRATALHHQIRGLNPWPGTYTTFQGENLKVWKSTPLLLPDQNLETEDRVKITGPGQIIQVLEHGLLVQTGEGFLSVLEVQPAGKRSMAAKDFYNGRHGHVGDRFE